MKCFTHGHGRGAAALVMTVSCWLAAHAQDPAALVRGRDFVLVCEDAGTGAYEAFPDVCRLQDGRLMCVFYAGWEHVSIARDGREGSGRVSACFSSDEGKTWSPAVTVYDGPDDDRDPSVVQLADGRILVNFFSLRKHGDSYRGLGTWLVESSDGGSTWSSPRCLSNYYCSSPIRVLSTGRLILGLYMEHDGKAWGAVTYSDDQGATWCAPVDIPNPDVRLDAETDLIELKDGRLYAALRGDKTVMHYSVSEDKGATWSVAAPLPFSGHCPYLHRASNGAILCAHRIPATHLHLSTDEASNWGDPIAIDSVGGAYPSMVNLKDESVLIVYYEEGPASSIRARKCRVDSEGIAWLPWDD